jgi:hypothetical protein
MLASVPVSVPRLVWASVLAPRLAQVLMLASVPVSVPRLVWASVLAPAYLKPT